MSAYSTGATCPQTAIGGCVALPRHRHGTRHKCRGPGATAPASADHLWAERATDPSAKLIHAFR